MHECTNVWRQWEDNLAKIALKRNSYFTLDASELPIVAVSGIKRNICQYC